ncbi:NAD(P)-dependent oxidoreductase [Marinicrinis lubricantis]|uniref:NAD(P)-dependent oxidoreductase n=1 Tax=Marinicrinis lubricantis TaxID=2086470 RepID=A0ABW1IVS6_9BACL
MNILVTAPFEEEDILKLQRFGSVIYRPWKTNNHPFSPSELIQLLSESDADALIIEHDTVTSTVFEQIDLKFIGVCRGTPSNVDLAAATRHHVPVFHTPARNAQAVAEYVLAEIISMLRKIPESKRWLQERSWTGLSHDSYLQFRGTELSGKTVGLVGLGGVGRRIAQLLKAFGCQIQYFDPYLAASPDPDYRSTRIEHVFATSDIVSIHLPVTKETIGSIDSRLLRQMKPDAIFVNSARAAVVDRKSLFQVLKEGSISGAIVDVFYAEPPDDEDYEMMNLPNVSATPHIAGNTFEVDKHHAEIMLEALHSWEQKHQPPKYLVNPEVQAHHTAS